MQIIKNSKEVFYLNTTPQKISDEIAAVNDILVLKHDSVWAVYIGRTNGVTPENGFLLESGCQYTLSGEKTELYAVSAVNDRNSITLKVEKTLYTTLPNPEI